MANGIAINACFLGTNLRNTLGKKHSMVVVGEGEMWRY